MSAIDNEIARFCDSMTCIRWNIEDCEKWRADYENNRQNYPAWVTKDGTQIGFTRLRTST